MSEDTEDKSVKFDEVTVTPEKCIELEYTYEVSKNKDGSSKPYTFRMRAIVTDNHVTLLNRDHKPIFDFRRMDKKAFMAFLQCIVQISQE